MTSKAKVIRNTWGTSMTFSMSYGSHALIFVNHTMILAWLSSNDFETRTIFNDSSFINFSSNNNTITINVTGTYATFTVFYI